MVKSGQDLGTVEAQACLTWILENEVDDDLLAEHLVALSDKGESIGEIVGFAHALISHAKKVNLPRNAIDVCGAGGSGLRRYNVSTTAAFVVAAGGVPVIKQSSGGSQRNGSLDLLQGLGCQFDFSDRFIEDLFDQTQLCFLDAYVLHPLGPKLVPAMTKALARRRILFRYLFPLANPVQTDFQLLGTAHADIAKRFAHALGAMDRRRALVVTGSPGIDELSVSGESVIFEYHNGEVRESILLPSKLGIPEVEYGQIPCGNCRENVDIFLSLVRKQEPRSVLDMVSLNAGAAFYCYGKVSSIEKGYLLSKGLFKDGLVHDKFLQFKAVCAAQRQGKGTYRSSKRSYSTN
jgi:anthranilate phosphoribosyltransferase